MEIKEIKKIIKEELLKIMQTDRELTMSSKEILEKEIQLKPYEKLAIIEDY